MKTILLILAVLLMNSCSSQRATGHTSYSIQTLNNCEDSEFELILKKWRPYLSAPIAEALTVRERWFIRDGVVFLRGPIKKGDYKYFLKLVNSEANDLRKLNVISFGGVTIDASLIGEYIYNQNYIVAVAGPCLSSCANYLFGFSKNRVFLKDGYVGFHGNHTAAVKEAGGIDKFLDTIKKNFKKVKTSDEKLNKQEVEKILTRIKSENIEVMEKEKKYFSYHSIPQSFFDKTQEPQKGYEGDESSIDYIALYPRVSALESLGFKITSGEPNLCRAQNLISKIRKKQSAILIAH